MAKIEIKGTLEELEKISAFLFENKIEHNLTTLKVKDFIKENDCTVRLENCLKTLGLNLYIENITEYKFKTVGGSKSWNEFSDILLKTKV